MFLIINLMFMVINTCLFVWPFGAGLDVGVRARLLGRYVQKTDGVWKN